MAFLYCAFSSPISCRNGFHGFWGKSPAKAPFFPRMQHSRSIISASIYSLLWWKVLRVSQALLRLLRRCFSVCSSLFLKDGRCTDSGIHPARQRGAGEGGERWREWSASLRSGSGQTLDSLTPSQAAADQQATDSRGLSAPIAAGGAAAPGISPAKALSSLFRILKAAIAPLKARSRFCFSPSPRPVVHARDERAHFRDIISQEGTTTMFSSHRAGLEGSIHSDPEQKPSFV